MVMTAANDTMQIMLGRQTRFLHLFLILCLTVSPSLASAASKPKLVFVLVIDQFRYDYLVKFRSEFGAGGFNRLLTKGAVFANTNYDYAGTETAPGHATISTGAFPTSHGIVGNMWFDRAKNKTVTSVEDPEFEILGVPPIPA